MLRVSFSSAPEYADPHCWNRSCSPPPPPPPPPHSPSLGHAGGGGGDAALDLISLEEVLTVATEKAKVMGATNAQLENFCSKLKGINTLLTKENDVLKEDSGELKTAFVTLQARCDKLAAEVIVLFEEEMQEAEAKQLSPELYKLLVATRSAANLFMASNSS